MLGRRDQLHSIKKHELNESKTVERHASNER